MAEAEDMVTADDTQPAATPRAIVANHNPLVQLTEYRFNFRPDKLGNKRDSVALHLPVPSVEGLVAILETGGKQLELLLEAAAGIVVTQAREMVNERLDITQGNLPVAELSWDYIAALEPKARTGGGIPQEQWDAFGADYLEIMPAATGKSEEQIGFAVKILLVKFSGQYKTNKPVLARLKEQLGVYLGASPRAEEFSDCIDFLVTKADRLLNASEEDLLGNL